jgi:flagellar protein FlgJ
MNEIALPKVDTTSPAYQRMHKQAMELEGVFLNTLMKEMFSSIDTSENSMGGGFAEETWRGMQAEQFANAMADKGGIGLADAMMADLLRLQEVTTETGVQS